DVNRFLAAAVDDSAARDAAAKGKAAGAGIADRVGDEIDDRRNGEAARGDDLRAAARYYRMRGAAARERLFHAEASDGDAGERRRDGRAARINEQTAAAV